MNQIFLFLVLAVLASLLGFAPQSDKTAQRVVDYDELKKPHIYYIRPD